MTAVVAWYAAAMGTLAVALWLLTAVTLSARLAPVARSHREPGGPSEVVPGPAGPPVGSSAPPWRTIDVSGATLSAEALRGREHLLVFVSATCVGCRASLPELRATLPGYISAGTAVVAIVVGDPGRGADIAAALAECAIVAQEPEPSPTAAANQVGVFPSYVLVDESGQIVATAHSVRELVAAGRA